MGYWKFSTLLPSVLFILGCAAPETPPQKTVLDPLVQTEQRARDLQKTVDQHADATRKAVDNQERGDTTP